MKKYLIVSLLIVLSYIGQSYSASTMIGCYDEEARLFKRVFCESNQTIAECCGSRTELTPDWFTGPKAQSDSVLRRRFSVDAPVSRHASVPIVKTSSRWKKFANKFSKSDSSTSSSSQESMESSMRSISQLSFNPVVIDPLKMVKVSCYVRSKVWKQPVPVAVIKCAKGNQDYYQKQCARACPIQAIYGGVELFTMPFIEFDLKAFTQNIASEKKKQSRKN